MMSLPDSKIETCAFCAAKLPSKKLGELEIGWRYEGKRDPINGFRICLKCRMVDIREKQEKVQRTWMKMKARAEKSCCGGGG